MSPVCLPVYRAALLVGVQGYQRTRRELSGKRCKGRIARANKARANDAYAAMARENLHILGGLASDW